MRNLHWTKTVSLLAIVLLAGLALVASAADAEDSAQARKDRILANLKFKFPQLEGTTVTIDDITPTEFEGLDEGSFSIAGRGSQKFLISRDDKKLYMVSGEPIDVSLSSEEVTAALAEREAEKARAAADRLKDLETSIAGLPFRGNADAPVTIVEFSDFQCPYCSRGASTVEQILEKYPNDVRFVFKNFPLGFHPWAKPAAIAALCAAQQNHDAFWTLHDDFFQNQREINPDNVLEKSKEFLGESGIDMDKWSACAENKESEAYKAVESTIAADMALGQKLGVSGTPGFFVNGEFLKGAQPLAAFEPLIEKAKSDAGS